jgi:tripartite-type tricarboxylate transporter receptor subunit TctC
MLRIASLLAGLLLIGAGAAQAQTWPARPIKLIVPNAAGTATDTMARLLANDLSKSLGQQMFVENVLGPSGMTGHQTAARSEPDGYTFLFTNTSGLAGNPVSFKKLPYDPTNDFTAVAMVCNLGPQMVSANKDAPFKTMAEFIAYAKANPGKLSYAVDATVGGAIFAGRLIVQRGGLEMPEVSYRGGAQMGPDVASGRVPVMISSIAMANPFLDSGQIRALAVTSSQRFPSMPDLPTTGEIVPGVVIDGWFVVVAPKGVPAAIVQRVNKEIGVFLAGADIQKRLIAIGLATAGAGTPESTAAFIAGQQERYRVFAKELNIEAQ